MSRLHPIPSPAARPPCGLSLRHSAAADADEHAANLRNWNQTYDQLSCGRFAGRVTELWLPRLQVFVETANRSLRQSCAAWERSLWFGIPAAADDQMRLGARGVAADAICVRRGGAEFELYTAPDFDLFGIVIEEESFARYLDATHQAPLDKLLGQRDQLHLPLPLKHAACDAIRAVLQDAAGPTHPEPARLQQRIQAVLAGLLAYAQGNESALRAQQRQRARIVAQIRATLLAAPDAPLTVAQLCERLHLSRRSLQNCVEAQTGLSPLAYMRALRLNAVRRALRKAAPVGDAAYTWGFQHLSQFAQDYRKLFGERPSEAARHSS